MILLVLCQIFAPLCFNLWSFWSVRSPTAGNLCKHTVSLAELFLSCECLSVLGVSFAVQQFVVCLCSCLPCDSSGSISVTCSLHYPLLLQLHHLKMLSVVFCFSSDSQIKVWNSIDSNTQAWWYPHILLSDGDCLEFLIWDTAATFAVLVTLTFILCAL